MTNSSPLPLAGKVAWITGSSRGLGRVMAEELVRLGANVAVHGTRQDSPRTFGEGESMEQVAREVAEAGPGDTMGCWCDVTDEPEIGRVAGEVRERFGQIDILVNSAGINTPKRAVAELEHQTPGGDPERPVARTPLPEVPADRSV